MRIIRNFKEELDLNKLISDFKRSINGLNLKILRPTFQLIEYGNGTKLIYVVYELPREMRHPEEYYDDYHYKMKDDPKYLEFCKIREDNDKVWKIISEFDKKYKSQGISFGQSGGASGLGVKEI